MAEIAVLKTHIINYAKTRDVYAGYRKAGYSKSILRSMRGDILLHKAAKNAFDELGVKRLPLRQELAGGIRQADIGEKGGVCRIPAFAR